MAYASAPAPLSANSYRVMAEVCAPVNKRKTYKTRKLHHHSDWRSSSNWAKFYNNNGSVCGEKKTMHIKCEHFVMAMEKNVKKRQFLFIGGTHFYTMKSQNDCWESARLLWCYEQGEMHENQMNTACWCSCWCGCFFADSHWPLTINIHKSSQRAATWIEQMQRRWKIKANVKMECIFCVHVFIFSVAEATSTSNFQSELFAFHVFTIPLMHAKTEWPTGKVRNVYIVESNQYSVVTRKPKLTIHIFIIHMFSLTMQWASVTRWKCENGSFHFV